VKTRLAVALGSERAERLHVAGADAVAAVLQALGPQLCAYYAVAEPGAAPAWPRLPCIAQGDGGLGDRLHHVYAALQSRHGAALLLGADAPQVDAVAIARAVAWLRDGIPRIAFGAALDGGFWLFGGNLPVERNIWTGIRYSAPDTGAALLGALDGRAELLRLPDLCDLDGAGDIAPVLAALQALPSPLPEQQHMADLLHSALRAQATTGAVR